MAKPIDSEGQKPKKQPPPTPAEQEAVFDELRAEMSEYHNAQALVLWNHRDTGHDLTVEEQLFCRSYIIDRNPVAAMQRLNYAGDAKSLKRRAEKLLASPEVMNCIDTLSQDLMKKLEVTAERVQARIAQVAFFDPRRVMEFDQYGVRLLHSKFWSEEDIGAVQSVKMSQNGVEIKFYDSLRATEMLSKQLGIQPEDDDRAEAVRIGADTAMNRILSFFDKVVPNDEPTETTQ